MEALIQGALIAEERSRKRGAIVEEGPARKIQKLENNSNTKSASATGNGIDAAKRGGKKKQKEEHKFPVQPRTIVVIKKPRTVMNHSYRDFSQVPAELNYDFPSKIEDMSFSQKVHHILSQKEYASFICWCAHGRSFKIHVPKIFEQQICSKYFGHSRYSSFLRLLNNYGFKHITQGPDRNCYYHGTLQLSLYF